MNDKLVYGIDKGSPDGDMSALTIRKGNKLFTYVGEEYEAIQAYCYQQAMDMLPEKKKDTSAEDLRAGTFTRGQDLEVYGYNQAIDDVRQKARQQFNIGDIDE